MPVADRRNEEADRSRPLHLLWVAVVLVHFDGAEHRIRLLLREPFVLEVLAGLAWGGALDSIVAVLEANRRIVERPRNKHRCHVGGTAEEAGQRLG